MDALRELYLSDNQLNGSIPPQLGNLGNLADLALHYNQLSGSIPPELGDLDSVEYLYLNDNQLTGPIPVELMGLASLAPGELRLCNNHLYIDHAAPLAPALESFLAIVSPEWRSCQIPLCLPGVNLLLLGD
ncbi:MAG TPA: hypothetical protein PKM59_15035 [Thermodesulfobacteriota bacterium]|nr:hypothetical protein [Thermodesulfobacteriota bacterium]HNU72249.1 hypothetical protein [Thermodesulfobacteriota bacterium]